jgi:hypothetical protein
LLSTRKNNFSGIYFQRLKKVLSQFLGFSIEISFKKLLYYYKFYSGK